MSKRPTQKDCDAWNAKHPVGTEVRVVLDDHTLHVNVTKSEAYMLGGHTPVVHVGGISGCYMLSRVTPTGA